MHQASRNRLRLDFPDVQSSAIVFDLDHDPIVPGEGAERHRALLGLSSCLANRRRLEAVGDGIPHHMDQRIDQPLDDASVYLGRSPGKDDIDILAHHPCHFPDRFLEPCEQRAYGDHPGAGNLIAQVGGHLLKQAHVLARFADRGTELGHRLTDISRHLGNAAREDMEVVRLVGFERAEFAMLLFKRPDRFQQPVLMRVHLARQLLKDRQAFLQLAPTVDHIADQIEQTLQPVPADPHCALDRLFRADGLRALFLLRGRRLLSLAGGHLAESWRERQKLPPDLGQPGRVSSQEEADFIHGVEEQVHQLRHGLHLPFADPAHDVFHVMGEVPDGLESHRVRGPFQGMYRTEQLVDRILVRRILLHPQQAGRNGFQVLLSFRDEVLQDFGRQLRPEVIVRQGGFFECRLGGWRRLEFPQQAGVPGFQNFENGGIFFAFPVDVVDLGTERPDHVS